MRDNFDTCLTLLWAGDPAWLNAKDRQHGLRNRTVASWRGCLVRDLEHRPLERGEASAILFTWFWRGIRADELPRGLDYALFDHAVTGGPKQAALDLRHLLNLRRLEAGQGVDGPLIRAAERADQKRIIPGLASFARDKERSALVAARALAMAENRHEHPDAA